MSARNRWSVADAKARWSEVIDQAERHPQVIERRGKPVAVVVGKEDFERVGDVSTGTLHVARLAEFLELSARIRQAGGAELRRTRRERRPSPFDRRR